jgi:predicted alpha/beta-fold hydrolase
MSKWCHRLLILVAAAGLLVTGQASAYDFPFEDPLLATVVGTPSQYQADLPEDTPRKTLELTIKPPGQIPEIFWYDRALRYSFLKQKQPAPLIFVIAGTGGGHTGRTIDNLQKVFYKAGFHVIALPSPTHSNFVTAASTTSVPGHAYDDAKDLYKVMEASYAQVKDQIEVTDFFLTGFSLGGFNAAFIAKLDEERRIFNFRKVLVLCPPVSLYNSVNILDAMLDDNVPMDAAEIGAHLDRVIGNLAAVYMENQHVEFVGDFLYTAYQQLTPDEEALKGLIGMAFRFSSANMAFTSDVISNAGFVVRKNTELGITTSLTPFAITGFRTTFANYLDGIMVPYFSARDAGLTRDRLIALSSLQEIESYLSTAEHIGMMTSADEIILAPGELDYLRDLFGNRATIYPRGGHCGNLAFPDNVEDMTTFFRDQAGE